MKCNSEIIKRSDIRSALRIRLEWRHQCSDCAAVVRGDVMVVANILATNNFVTVDYALFAISTYLAIVTTAAVHTPLRSVQELEFRVSVQDGGKNS